MLKVFSFITALLVLPTIWRAEAQRKCDCRVVRCAGVDERTCKYGVGLNACGCCQVCLLGPGEACGLDAKCGTGLKCVKRNPRDATGICQRSHRGKRALPQA